MVERLFLAVPLTDEARHALATRLSGRRLPGRPVQPRNWHLTLRFVGDVEEYRRDRIMGVLDEADLGGSFRVRLGEVGAFPGPSKATVLWVGFAHGGEELATLAQAAELAMEAAGVPEESRPFRAHLTLSRVRPQQDVTTLLEQTGPVGVGWTVERVVLYRSHLGSGGARYEELASFGLGGRGVL